ncbi:hypothetical protein ABB02_01228 [Clostridiaceae bacterium JG1575]|nr:hypothetical protein ABB02_01228 [Clostridiaceae bacterium JG1575]
MSQYQKMSELLSKEAPEHYTKSQVLGTHPEILVIAPHGGSIEYLTEELARGVAGEAFSLFVFSGHSPTKAFERLHVTSHCYDCPDLEHLNQRAVLSLAIHGCKDSQNARTYLGGRDLMGRNMVQRELQGAGFAVLDAPEHLSGMRQDNLVNQNLRSAGIQLEITTLQRRALDPLLRAGHKEAFDRYVNALQRALWASYAALTHASAP